VSKLQQLHEQFIEMANRPMTLGALPITPRDSEVPVIAIDRWKESGGALYKTYRFRRMSDRSRFVMGLLAYEAGCEHCADITIKHDTVSLKLQTQDIGKPTELDKEYARYADVLFRDLVYSSGHGTED
jgi:pterin-4a-carbinolamine dehydratase